MALRGRDVPVERSERDDGVIHARVGDGRLELNTPFILHVPRRIPHFTPVLPFLDVLSFDERPRLP